MKFSESLEITPWTSQLETLAVHWHLWHSRCFLISTSIECLLPPQNTRTASHSLLSEGDFGRSSRRVCLLCWIRLKLPSWSWTKGGFLIPESPGVSTGAGRGLPSRGWGPSCQASTRLQATIRPLHSKKGYCPTKALGLALTGACRVWSCSGLQLNSRGVVCPDWGESGCRLPTSHHREAFQTCVHQVSFSTFLHLVRPSEAVSWQGTREERGLSSACTDRSLLPLHHPCKHAKLTYAVSDQNAICRILSSLLTLIPSLFKL